MCERDDQQLQNTTRRCESRSTPQLGARHQIVLLGVRCVCAPHRIASIATSHQRAHEQPEHIKIQRQPSKNQHALAVAYHHAAHRVVAAIPSPGVHLCGDRVPPARFHAWNPLIHPTAPGCKLGARRRGTLTAVLERGFVGCVESDALLNVITPHKNNRSTCQEVRKKREAGKGGDPPPRYTRSQTCARARIGSKGTPASLLRGRHASDRERVCLSTNQSFTDRLSLVRSIANPMLDLPLGIYVSKRWIQDQVWR